MAGSIGHQVGHGDIQGDGQFLYVHQRDVPLAAFNATNVGPMKARELS
jgi:hypothetical protein